MLGYGSQGRAHALNLHDSGVDVVVGLREGSKSIEQATEDGLEVKGIADATSDGDVVMVLLPDETQGQAWEDAIRDGIAPGNLLMFAHGFSIHYDEIDPDPGVDVGDGRAEEPGTSRAPPVRAGAGRSRPAGDSSGRDGQHEASSRSRTRTASAARVRA